MSVILRLGKKGAFTYHTESGAIVTDPVVLEYVSALVIPPAYKNVRIFYEKSPKILFTGVDSKERLQRIYSMQWRKEQDRLKFCELLKFSEKVRQIVTDVNHNIVAVQSPPTKAKIISLIIKLVMVCHFRIGNHKYKELYGSYGAMNILKKHVTTKNVGAGGAGAGGAGAGGAGGAGAGDPIPLHMIIKFTGKKSVINSCEIDDVILINNILHLIKDKSAGQTVFQYKEDGKLCDVTAVEFNRYLGAYDPSLTSKMFRTWDSNMLFIIYMQSLGDPAAMSDKERKKNLTAAYVFVSEKINNTPAILKKSYTQSGLSDMYMDYPKKYRDLFMTGDPRDLFTSYLKTICK